MASSKMAKNDTAASDDAERATLLAERCVALLKALPVGRGREPGDGDGPWINWYEKHQGEVLADLEIFIKAYFSWQRHAPDLQSRWRKDFDDMHKAAVKFAASIRRLGVRNSLPHDDNRPDLEAMLANLESMIMWMGNNPSKHLLPPLSRDPNKHRSRSFVEWVIFVVAGYTGETIKQDTKGTPTAELEVLKEIVAMVDPTIGEGTITEALKHIRKTGFDPRGSRRANELAIGFFPAYGAAVVR
jgi:hypothetical protein